VNSASDAFYRAFDVVAAESEGRLIYELGNRQWDIPELRTLLEDILPRKSFFNGYEVNHVFESLGHRTMLLNARRLDSADGTPDRIVLAIEDITARHEGEAVIRQNRELFLAVIEQAPVGVYVVDGQMRIQHVNSRALPVFEQVVPLMGRDFGEVMHILWPPQTARGIMDIFRHTLETGEPYLAPSFTERREDRGVEESYDWQLRRIVLPDGQRGVVCYFNDITARKKADEVLRVAIAEIERGSRAKDDFLAALSHELRTPLTPVLMTATALENDSSLSPEVRDQLAMMRRNVELEARLIDDLLDLTRISRGKLIIAPAVADLHQLLEQTAEIVRSDGLGKQVRIIFRFEAARHHAMVDQTRFQQVCWNLVKNALKFTPTGGRITVSTQNDSEGWIVISVADTGIGIGAEALPNVFKAFEQGDVAGQHRYGGLGLGLAISQAIMTVHGGMIRAESEGPGRGATFTVALPTVDATAATALAGSAPAGPAPALRLLIVEDHEATRVVLSRLLSRIGYQVTTVGSVKGALASFAAERFDAVISDLGLPDGSGLELMREIQRRRPVPGIALSGYGMEEDLRQTKEAGFFAHLVKPVNLDQLRLLLDQLAVRE